MKSFPSIKKTILLLAGLVLCFVDSFSQSKVEVFRIDKPDITRPEVPFPNIILNKLDTVKISAGGCVQTGGKGKTWKRYPVPADVNMTKKDFLNAAVRLYIGSFTIQGFALKQRLSDYASKSYVMPEQVNHAIFKLGFSDDDYTDNGYWGRRGDDGTYNQCKGLGNAWVVVKINRAHK